jgi:hypothetical protein
MSLLTRAELWSQELKDTLKDELVGRKYVRMLTEFPDGSQFNIPSIGDARTDDVVEDTDIQMRAMDTGEFTFTIDEYISSGHYITRKAEQDSFYASELVSSFVPKQNRAIMEHFETAMLTKPDNGMSASATDPYLINGVAHRFSGGNSGTVELADFAYANLALTKSHVPAQNRIAIVPPEVAFYLDTLASLVAVQNNPMWGGIVADGIATGMTFAKNVYGFDVYSSNYLPASSSLTNAPNALDERDQSTAGPNFTSVVGAPCYFFSAASDILPFVGAWRQEPMVDAEWVPRKQRTEIVTTARYGVKLYRPENMVICHTKTAIT